MRVVETEEKEKRSERMSEYATIEHYVNHVMDEITKRDVEQVSERLRALGWEEVVRCRDCKQFANDSYFGAFCRYFSAPLNDDYDGFCYLGIRRVEKCS